MEDNVKNKYEAMRKAMLEFNKEFGGEINKAIPKYEDPTRYPISELVDLFKFQMKFRNPDLSREEKDALKKEFAEKVGDGAGQLYGIDLKPVPLDLCNGMQDLIRQAGFEHFDRPPLI